MFLLFTKREREYQKRIWKGDHDFRLDRVEISGDGFKGLEIREVWLEMEICKSWVYGLMGKLGWTRRKYRAEDRALINGIYWLRKGGAPNGKWLERSERRLETDFPETNWSMPLSSQVQNQNLYPKPMHGSLF